MANYHVSKDKESGMWKVTSEGLSRATEYRNTQGDAEKVAKDNNMNIQTATEAVKQVQESNPVSIFWTINKQKITIVASQYRDYLKSLGIYKYYAEKSQTFVFVCKKESKIFPIFIKSAGVVGSKGMKKGA